MSCNCTTPASVAPVNPELPTLSALSQACADTVACATDECLGTTPASVTGSPVSRCADSNALRSSASCGYTLPNGFTDPIADRNNEGVTLLGRIGAKLAKLTGSGFIKIVEGKAFIVSSVPIKISTLWHQWWKPTGINARPALGAPLPFHHAVIADSVGNLHGIKGGAEDAGQVWNSEMQQWEVRAEADRAFAKRGHLERAASLELVGLEAIAVSGTGAEVRNFKTLAGSGLIVVEQTSTTASSCDCPGCEPVPAMSSIARFVPFPSGDATWTLKWDAESGPHWVED
jgi:hypothetical protein